MAIGETIITAVRVAGSDGDRVDYAWDPSTWYLLRDDCPRFDFLTTGHFAQAKGDTKLQPLKEEPAPEGAKWQRWDLEADLARQRRLGDA